MRLARVGARGQELPALLHPDGRLLDLSGVVSDITSATISKLDHLRSAVENPGSLPELHGESSRFGPPIADPGKIVCVGLNYRLHAQEAGLPIPEEPILFLKAPYTIGGPDDTVPIPPRSQKTDYEVELAVVIGQVARYLDPDDDALDYVAGYTISDDVSERAFQLERGGQWDKGKNCEGFNPLGPFLVTADEVADPQALDLELSVNGELRQRSNTSDMTFAVSHLVRYISQFMTLLPGDIINTGTPSGVGSGFEPPRFLRDRDVVELSISGLGKQRHRFIPAPLETR